MTTLRLCRWCFRTGFVFLLTLASAPVVRAQICFNGPELDAPTRNAIESAARKYFDMSAHGDVAGLKANAIPAITGDFSSIEQAVVTNKAFLAGGQAAITGTYLLDASQAKATLPRADFYCGIFNSPDRIGFFIPNLPPGRYAIVFQKVDGKDPATLTLILQEMSGAWKLAGYYPRLDSIGGHDGQWYLSKARELKSKGQPHNAWFYYLTAWDLLAPVNFMSTPQLDKVADEMQAARPADLPNTGTPMNLSANGKSLQGHRNSARGHRQQPLSAHRLRNSRRGEPPCGEPGQCGRDPSAGGEISRAARRLLRGGRPRRGRQRPRLRLGADHEGD